MGDIRGGVEQVVDAVSSVSADHRAVIGSCNRLTTPSQRLENMCHGGTNMVFPISRNSAPGLQTLIAASKHARVV